MSSRYDSAITVFSPDGQLFQVQYAQEAVKKGSTAVGVRGTDSVILAVERKSAAKLQDTRTVRKIALIDDHIAIVFAGLTADARVLINKARIEAQSYGLTYEDVIGVEVAGRFVARVQQSYTQSGGVRPFGISTLIAGFEHHTNVPRLFMTEPSGVMTEWRSNAIGRSSATVREFLEKNWEPELKYDDAVKLAVRALLEVVETGSKNIEVAVMKRSEQGVRTLADEEVDAVIAEIQAEKQAQQQQQQPPSSQPSTQSTQSSSQPSQQPTPSSSSSSTTATPPGPGVPPQPMQD
eukprot:ANDGO_06327.mRNA.1 Proteasome subunit alpha type-7-B